MLISSHSFEDIRALCDRVIVLNHHRIEFDGTPEQAFAKLEKDLPITVGGMKIMSEILALARLEIYLLRRQKLVLGALILGCAGLFLAFAVASASYMWPEKFIRISPLGCFCVHHVSGNFEASSMFADERQRRTLHLLLASGISKRSWIWGNFFGLLATSIALLALWSALAFCISFVLPDTQSH